MENRKYHIFSQLQDEKDTTWKVKARVMRIWNGINLKTDEVFSLEMVLMDENEDQIHAVVSNNYIEKYKSLLKVGEVYYISPLNAALNKKNYRPVCHLYKLYFRWNTTVRLANDDTASFPRHKFNFIEFDKLSTRLNIDTYLTDVIGNLIGSTKKKIMKRANGREVPMREILIEHSSGAELKITLWDEAANQIDDEMLHNPTTSIIVIATSTTVRMSKAKYYLTTTTASKVYINLEVPEVDNCREKCKKIQMIEVLQTPEPKNEKLEDVLFRNRKTISELMSLIQDPSCKGITYTCKATISNVFVEYGWYYMSCHSCTKKTSNVDNMIWCNTCNIEVPFPKPRYRLRISVEDSTGSANFTLFDKEVEMFTQQTVSKLIEIQEKEDDTEKITNIFNQLRNNERVFQIKMDSYNMFGGSKSLTVNKIYPIELSLENKYSMQRLQEGMNGSNNDSTESIIDSTGSNDDSTESCEKEYPRKRLCKDLTLKD